MSTRQVISWRIYVYANSLYSLPPREKRSFREWSPQALRNDPCAIHRIMDWVNRDASVLVRSSEEEMVKAYETVQDMLSHVNMRSVEFQNTLFSFFGEKTNHFIHELINFSRSPYDDPIAYELNVQYRAVLNVFDDDVDMPCTSAEALKKQQANAELHNFVQFASRMDNDDCISFDADMELEVEDTCAIDELIMSSPYTTGLRGLAEAVTAGYAGVPEQQPPQQQQAPPQQQPPPQMQQQQQEQARQGSSYVDPALQEAIARSMMDLGVVNRQRIRMQRRFLMNTGDPIVPSTGPSASGANSALMAVRAHIEARRALAATRNSTGPHRRRRRNGLNLDHAFNTYGGPPL
ncbi:uncharacterized protein LOC111079474 [Drosophila obscura]|uniref:uncharacterized protein LOC111079474 n=1 Tax=Drosophila obscura TaxID=7282 RepID=UPI001BB28269|nr:uncharacterized protein LOC111079474 [Drosophila obscura]XP_022230356.2 uncharacterized protein LOC111079474 [Drosophila obscura]